MKQCPWSINFISAHSASGCACSHCRPAERNHTHRPHGSWRGAEKMQSCTSEARDFFAHIQEPTVGQYFPALPATRRPHMPMAHPGQGTGKAACFPPSGRTQKCPAGPRPDGSVGAEIRIGILLFVARFGQFVLWACCLTCLPGADVQRY
jgi:hypothetical protein